MVVGNGWEPTGPARRRARRSALAEDLGIPAGRNAGVAARRAASCCSSSTTTRASPRPDALARVAARFAADPELGLLQLRVDAVATAARRRATGCRGCASATRRARAT